MRTAFLHSYSIILQEAGWQSEIEDNDPQDPLDQHYRFKNYFYHHIHINLMHVIITFLLLECRI